VMGADGVGRFGGMFYRSSGVVERCPSRSVPAATLRTKKGLSLDDRQATPSN
jgi:hypothetical protein